MKQWRGRSRHGPEEMNSEQENRPTGVENAVLPAKKEGKKGAKSEWERVPRAVDTRVCVRGNARREGRERGCKVSGLFVPVGWKYYEANEEEDRVRA